MRGHSSCLLREHTEPPGGLASPGDSLPQRYASGRRRGAGGCALAPVEGGLGLVEAGYCDGLSHLVDGADVVDLVVATGQVGSELVGASALSTPPPRPTEPGGSVAVGGGDIPRATARVARDRAERALGTAGHNRVWPAAPSP